MLPVGSRHESKRGTVIEIVSRDDEHMSFDRTYAPDSGRADPHYHLDFTQTWEGLEGEGRIEIDGEEQSLAAGQRAEIAPGVPHRDPWVRGPGPFQVRGTFEPCNEFIEAYAEAWAERLEAGTTNGQEELGLIHIVAISRVTDGQSFGAGVPVALQKAVSPLFAVIARLRGFRTDFG